MMTYRDGMRSISLCIGVLVIRSTLMGALEVVDTTDSPMVAFAAGHLTAMGDFLEPSDAGGPVTIQIVPGSLPGQAFSILPSKNGIKISAGDERGAMYGTLELAEHIRLYRNLPDAAIEDRPFIEQRGIKMNIPLDARTPSYDDTGDAALANTANVWDLEFWKAYLDSMALNRYNVLSLWNPHPFPSMIQQEAYEDVALDDVYITTLEPAGIENEWGEPQLVSTNVLQNLEKIKTITIEEKIRHWRAVFKHARQRGIDLYFFTWNICPNSVAKPVEPFYRTYSVPVWDEEPGKYGVSHQINNPSTVDYMRDAISTFLHTYPEVTGIGITAGEHMPHNQEAHPVEGWLWETYGKGILDYKEGNQERRITLIHRIWNTDIGKIMEYWDTYPDDFQFSLKYAKARLYATTKPPFAEKQIAQMKAFGMRSWLNLRNDDIFVHQWGDPDYVREFLGNIDIESTVGYVMGSDGYVWGKDFTSKDPDLIGRLEFDRHWYRFMLWGRLGYNPSLGREFWIRQLASKYQEVDAECLYEAWQAASRIIPQVNRFHWRDWDHQWSVEGCMAHIGGFRDVFDFVENPTLQGSGLMNPRRYVEAVRQKRSDLKGTPPEVAARLESAAHFALGKMAILRSEVTDKLLLETLSNIEGMSYLGLYYAAKIRAATELAWFQQTETEDHLKAAIAHAESGLEQWNAYARIGNSRYHDQHLARTKNLNWSLLTREVEHEVQLLRNYALFPAESCN